MTASLAHLILTGFTKNVDNRKLNFCSAGMSQEAFLPHINGVAARHFWKKKQHPLKKSLELKTCGYQWTECKEEITESDMSVHEKSLSTGS